MVILLKNAFLSSEYLHFASPFLKQMEKYTDLGPEYIFLPGNHKEELEGFVQFSTHMPIFGPRKSMGQTHRTVPHQQCACIGLYSSSPKKKCEKDLVEVNTFIIVWVY